MILKPFMLRRVKREVEQEIAPKIESEIHCVLTPRQRKLYLGIKSKISISELLEKHFSESNMSHLMNLVMQFRKVCNHPEIFERSDVKSPFQFNARLHTNSMLDNGVTTIGSAFHSTTNSSSSQTSTNHIIYVAAINYNPITFVVPKMLYREGLTALEANDSRRKILINTLNIFTAAHLHASLFETNESQSLCDVHEPKCFSFLRFMDMSLSELEIFSRLDFLHRCYALWKWWRRCEQLYCYRFLSSENLPIDRYARFLIVPLYDTLSPVNVTAFANHQADDDQFILREIVTYPIDRLHHHSSLWKRMRFVMPSTLAPPIQYHCPDRSFSNEQQIFSGHTQLKSFLLGSDYAGENNYNLLPNEKTLQSLDFGNGLKEERIASRGLQAFYDIFGSSCISIPDLGKLLSDSGKLRALDSLLTKLKSEGHRVLIYSQMTKMIDILEDFMHYRKHRFIRLDGQSKLSDRRDMVEDFQTRPEIFIFLLSTRAGGLGINLTAADTVIFYDSDWNPTMDEQAMDRAHRLGQTRQVTVYRLITKGTIEERILKRAKQKHIIQSIVIAGGKFHAEDQLSANEVVSLLLDDEQVEENVSRQLESRNKKRGRKAKAKDDAKEDTENANDQEKQPKKRTRGFSFSGSTGRLIDEED